MRLFHLRARSFRTPIPFPGRLVSSLARFQYPLVGRVYALAFFISIERLLEPLSLNSSVVPIDDEVIDVSWSFPPDAHVWPCSAPLPWVAPVDVRVCLSWLGSGAKRSFYRISFIVRHL
jgi:hypothetical protein